MNTIRKLTRQEVQADLDSLAKNYKTKDVDGLIRRYVKEGADVSDLRGHILTEQQFHRIYYYVSLKQLKNPGQRLRFITDNMFFSDWWHTDQLIKFVSDVDFDTAFACAEKCVYDEDTFIRRWGYVMFISKLCRSGENLPRIISLLHDDDEYYVQMAEAWLIAELAIFFPEDIYDYLKNDCTLKYSITGKAVQKILDSYRISDEYKEKFKALRPTLKTV